MVRIILLFACVTTYFILLSNKGGRNQESTGAPHENNPFACAECHSGGNYTPTVAVTLKDVNNQVVTKYTSGSEYTVEFKINSATGNPSYYGFQAVTLNPQNKQSGEYISLGDKVRKLTLSERVYLMQISPRPDGLFTAKWKAGNADTTTFFISGLAANGNNGTGGDKNKTGAFSFTRNLTSSNQDFISMIKKLQSNIVSDRLIFREPIESYRIIDNTGKILLYNTDAVSELATGIYFLQYTSYGKSNTEKFYKL